MTRIKSECVDCEPRFKNCMACGLKNVETHFCDECGDEIDGIRYVDDEGFDYCSDCARDYMLGLIEANLNTLELFEMMKAAGFDELERAEE